MNNINESSWSKDFDFIEESYGYSEPLKFTEVKEDIIVEAELGKPSTYKILGKASGVFQTVGGYSRNKRYYTPEHWKIQLDNTHVQERLAQRDIMGTLGHSADRPINDDDIAKGLVSHLVTKLEIKEDANGKPFLYGELEILDTPAGRILKGLYEGGANLYVSSRGAGKLEPMPEQIGMMRVNPHSYWFEGFDMVRRPGFLEAKPVFEQVKESVEEKEVKPEVHESRPETKAKVSTWAAVSPVISEAASESEVETLKAQVERLAKVVEKVVEDTYEVEEERTPEELSESLTDFFELMTQTNVSEDTMKDILDIIFNKKEENK